MNASLPDRVPEPARPLFNRYPAMRRSLPLCTLAQLPTPITPCDTLARDLGIGELYIKRDDLTGERYGGNKVRKLEFILGKALQDDAREVMTFGYAGSNHATATAIYASTVGLRSISMLLPQANARYVRRNLLASFAAGAELNIYPSQRALALGVTLQMARRRLATGKFPMVVPPGGSSTTGIVGFVNAAVELHEQIERGELPRPDTIYLAMGTMGSLIGLSIGLMAAGLAIPIVGVRVTPPQYANRAKFDDVVDKTVALLREADPSFPLLCSADAPIEMRDEFFGEGYAQFTNESVAAVKRVNDSMRIPLEGTYTGKAFAAIVSDGNSGVLRGKRVLFWNTHNSVDVAGETLDRDYRRLPKEFHRYFEEPVQPLDVS